MKCNIYIWEYIYINNHEYVANEIRGSFVFHLEPLSNWYGFIQKPKRHPILFDTYLWLWISFFIYLFAFTANYLNCQYRCHNDNIFSFNNPFFLMVMSSSSKNFCYFQTFLRPTLMIDFFCAWGMIYLDYMLDDE